MAMHGHSEACCNTPAVRVADYKQKGEFVEINGLKTYKTGPNNAKTALLVIYDVFGFSPQILQGADILAHEDDQHHQYRVFMPDFLEGKYAKHEWFPAETDQAKKELGEFFQGPAQPGKTIPRVSELAKAIGEKYGGIEQWALVGYCWGGKIVSLSSQSGTMFKAGAQCHPAMVDAKDAEGISIPMCMLPSGDESEEDLKKFMDTLKGPKHIETFKDQLHGWMAARGDLDDKHIKAEYERGYKQLVDFFHKHVPERRQMHL